MARGGALVGPLPVVPALCEDHIRPMPRIRTGRTIDVSYVSPNVMVDHLSDAVKGKEILLPMDDAVPIGLEKEITLNVPWLGRQVHVMGRVTGTTSTPDGQRVHVLLMDGPLGRIDQIAELLGRFRQGHLVDETHGETLAKRIRSMSPSLRAMLAVKATAEERKLLMTDADPNVIDLLLKNPNLSIAEVRILAGRRNVAKRHLEYIARNTVWMADAEVRLVVARSPKIPDVLAPAILKPLQTSVLREIALNPNTVLVTRRLAIQLLKERGVEITTKVWDRG